MAAYLSPYHERMTVEQLETGRRIKDPFKSWMWKVREPDEYDAEGNCDSVCNRKVGK